MPRRRQPEAQLQRAVIEHLRLRGSSDVFWYHIPMGGYRSRNAGAEMKSLGAKAGLPDLAFVKAGSAKFLELKADKGSLSEAQRDVHAQLRAAGGEVQTAYDIGDALRILEGWEILEGHTPLRGGITPASPPARVYHSTRHEAARQRYMAGLSGPAPRVPGWDLSDMFSATTPSSSAAA
jgi:hypothetical protein